MAEMVDNLDLTLSQKTRAKKLFAGMILDYDGYAYSIVDNRFADCDKPHSSSLGDLLNCIKGSKYMSRIVFGSETSDIAKFYRQEIFVFDKKTIEYDEKRNDKFKKAILISDLTDPDRKQAFIYYLGIKMIRNNTNHGSSQTNSVEDVKNAKAYMKYKLNIVLPSDYCGIREYIIEAANFVLTKIV